jgi:creatinine amidohydrolase
LYLLPHLYPPKKFMEQWRQILETDNHGHACECETSVSLANFPHLVKMEALDGRKAEPLGRFEHLRPGDVAAQWYSDYPDHYAGDATAATVEKGKQLLALQVEALADYVRAVKDDRAVHAVLADFYDRCDRLGE